MNHNCPICNKAGLPNYRISNVICPQCNSDLKAFSLLNSISKPQKTKIGKFVILGISLLTIVLLGLLINSNSDKKELAAKTLILKDSITKIQSINIAGEKEETISQPSSKKQDISVMYVIKKGDYPYKIAQFFYNDGNKYKQIEAINNLQEPYTLKVGQSLTIRILQ